MIITLDGFIVYHNEDWYERPTYVWQMYEPNESETTVIVRPHTLMIEVPDNFDPRERQIAALRRRRETMIATASAAVSEVDEKISKLLALSGPER
jgi:hypothetical protein